MANVVIELTGKEASLVRAWQRSKQSVDEFNRAMDGAAAKGNKAGGILADMPIKFATGLGMTVSAVGALTTAAALLKSEYDGMVQRQNAALGTQVTYAKAQRAAVDNFLPDATMSTDAYRQSLLDISKDTKASPPAVLEAAGKAMSAKGAMSNADTMAAVKEVLAFNPMDSEGGAAMAPGIVSMMNAYKLSAKEALGVMLGVKGTSRIETDQDLGTKAATAISQQQPYGDSPQHAGALYSFFSNKMGDFTGGRTDTAMTQFSSQLEMALPNLKDTEERIAFLRSNTPEANAMRDDLLGKIENDMRTKGTLHGEAAAAIPMRELLQPSQNEFNKTYDEMRKSQVATEEAPAYVDMRKRDAENTDLQKLAFKKLSADTDAELAKIQQTGAGGDAQYRQEVEGIIADANISEAVKRVINAAYAIGETAGNRPQDMAASAIDKVADELEKESELGGLGPKKPADQLKQDREKAAALRERAEKLRGDTFVEDQEAMQGGDEGPVAKASQRETEIADARRILSVALKRSGMEGDEQNYQDWYTAELAKKPEADPLDIFTDKIAAGAEKDAQRKGSEEGSEEFQRAGDAAQRMKVMRLAEPAPGDKSPAPTPAASESDKLLEENNRRMAELTSVLSQRFSTTTPQIPRGPLAAEGLNRRT